MKCRRLADTADFNRQNDQCFPDKVSDLNYLRGAREPSGCRRGCVAVLQRPAPNETFTEIKVKSESFMVLNFTYTIQRTSCTLCLNTSHVYSFFSGTWISLNYYLFA